MTEDKCEVAARRGRLFELFRQEYQAEKVVARVGDFEIRHITAKEMIQFQRAALRSLHTNR